MLNTYQKAREFKEKYSMPPVSQTQLDSHSNQLLEDLAHKYIRKLSSIKAKILVMETELASIAADLSEFLDNYYEKFLTLDTAVTEQPDDIKVSDAFADEFENIKNENKAFFRELRSVYRQLAKHFHPDTGLQASPEKFHQVQDMYDKRDLDGMLYIKYQLEEESLHSSDIITRINMLELGVVMASEKLLKLEGRKAMVLSSKEYELYLRHRLYEVRGFDFFKEIDNRLKVNQS